MRVCVLILMVLVWVAQDASAVTETERLAAIQRIQTHLLSQQDPETGGWDTKYTGDSRHRGGETALVTYALLRSGMSVQETRLQAAAEYLQDVRMNGTYAVSLRTHCWAALSDDYRALLAADARWLLQAQVGGLFDYGPRTGPRFDNSVTQYGLLGLWESAKRRGPTANRVWLQASQHFIDTQNPDGGWAYTDRGGSSASMTAAGLTALLIAQENVYRSSNKPPPKLTLAINGGIDWLDRHTSERGVTVSDSLYYLVSLERAALAGGIRTLGGRDWFDEGAQSILDAERGIGNLGDQVDTAFALIFLSRGGVPVWANKLRLKDQAWNNRPNDLSLFTRQLSDQVETELGWQVIDASSNTWFWLNTPVAYVASDGPVSFDASSLANLKLYLDLGGLLVATPDGNNKAFGESIRRIATRLYPRYSFTRVQADHPLMSLVFPIDLPEDKRPWVLTNGVRDLIVLAPADWGMALQSKRVDMQNGASGIMANLHALVTDRGRETIPLYPGRVDRVERTDVPMLRVMVAIDDEHRMLEPLSWLPLANPLYNDTGYDLKLMRMPIERISGTQSKLVYLGGAEARRLTPRQLRLLVVYVQGGGTILIETIGGRGDYTQEVLRQFEAVFGQPAIPLSADHPIISGEGLAVSGDAQGDITYRRYSTLNRGLVGSARLLSINLDGRAAIIASHEDLSLGVMGSRRWGIDGYEIDTARRLLTNILLFAEAYQPVPETQSLEVPLTQEAPSDGTGVKLVP
jgi:Domain of unknown function (DUF4159)